ncbi:TetR/AcrR family transcriptional regulator [Microbacterium sp. NPDC089987]|uniref:TetR/AcrR family transcriptional regulator n=1 Tax=Microbacterium sp. NPDC089987 TaxID=3364202 RepID=UPI00381AEB2D
MARRGAYAKGVAKREEILAAALAVVAERGYGKASVREIAEAAGLSPAGLLHYFGSKEELFVAILAARDARDTEEYEGLSFAESLVAIVRHNASVPGLVHLYARLAADAGDAEHPARKFFLDRTAMLETMARDALAEAQQEGEIRADVSPEWVMRVLHAAADGLQTAWMLDPTIDMAADLEEFLRVLRPV